MRKMIVSMLSLIALFSAAASLPPPYAHWKMDAIGADGKVSDVSGNGFDMTVGEGVSEFDDDIFGRVLRWKGVRGSWGTFRNRALTNRTVSLWFRRDAQDGDVDSVSNNKIPYVFSGFSAMSVNFSKGTAGMNSELAKTTVYGVASPSRSRWHQLTVTFEATGWADAEKTCPTGVFRSYVDGVIYKTVDNFTAAGAASQEGNAVVGNSSASSSSSDPRPFKGLFSQIRIWDVALASDDVQQLYLDDLSALGTVPLGRWRLDATLPYGSASRKFEAANDNIAELECRANAKIVFDGDMGCNVAEFPNYAKDSYASLALPFPVADFSFGMWMKVPDDLVKRGTIGAIDEPTAFNTMPNVYNFSGYSRMNFEGSYRNADSTQGKVYDVATRDNSLDSGYGVPFVTVQKGRWSHFGVTLATGKDANGGCAITPRFYVDGVCVYTGRTQSASSYTGNIPKGTQFILGTGSTSLPRSFLGQMSDFAAYSGLMDDAQMAELARGLPEVSAGEDFSLAAGVWGRLSGEVSLTGKTGNGRAAATKTQWMLVSWPLGGENAEIVMEDSPNAMIRLEAVGEYKFRLRAKSGSLRCCEYDEVTVTCVPKQEPDKDVGVAVNGVAAAVKGAWHRLAAAVSGAEDADLSIRWKMISGPGTVSFEPASGADTAATFHKAGVYAVAAVAFDGHNEYESAPFTVEVSECADMDLASGLLAHWTFEPDCTETVTGTKYEIDRTVNTFETGACGYAVRCNGAFYPYLNTGMTLLETTSDSTYSVPDERYRAFSLWMYHDPADTNNSSHASIVSVAYTLGLWYNCEDGVNGFTMYQQATENSPAVGFGNTDVYGRPDINPAGRWTHVYALFDRTTSYLSNTSELWIDGVKMSNRTVNGMGGGRVRDAEKVMIGGHKNNGDGYNGHMKDSQGNRLSRTFPGVIDEVRMYNRRLTEAEIKYLAANPVVDVNRAPSAFAELQDRRVFNRKEAALAGFGDDDGMPSAELSGRWQVIDGDASAVSFGDASAGETVFKAVKTGRYAVAYVVCDGEKSTWSEPLVINVEHPGMTVKIR